MWEGLGIRGKDWGGWERREKAGRDVGEDWKRVVTKETLRIAT